MPLTRSFDETVRERAQWDSEFRKTLLPDTLDILLGGEVRVGKILLRQCIYATIGYKKLASLTGKTPESLNQMLHPDYDTSVNDLFEIIKHIRKHEGISLEVKAHSNEQESQPVHDEPVEPLQTYEQESQPVRGEPVEPLHPIAQESRQ